jgi:hypothetical protein
MLQCSIPLSWYLKSRITSKLCRLRSRTDQRRATEVEVAVHVLNRMLELGRPESVRIA